MTNPDNRATVAWVHDELTKAETSKSHVRIVIEVQDGTVHHVESANKKLARELNK